MLPQLMSVSWNKRNEINISKLKLLSILLYYNRSCGKKKQGKIFIFKMEIIRIWCTGPLNIWRSDNKVPSWASEKGIEV